MGFVALSSWGKERRKECASLFCCAQELPHRDWVFPAKEKDQCFRAILLQRECFSRVPQPSGEPSELLHGLWAPRRCWGAVRAEFGSKEEALWPLFRGRSMGSRNIISARGHRSVHGAEEGPSVAKCGICQYYLKAGCSLM